MTSRKFLNRLANGKKDILRIFLGILAKTKTEYCVIGGLAVNAYAEPVVSLDLDIVVAAEDADRMLRATTMKGFKAKKFEHSVNLTSPDSDLRIQVQTDTRYQGFLARAIFREVLGYKMKVAVVEDVLQGKIWAYSDVTRRNSKRQKDLADIMRLVEARPALKRRLPAKLRKIAGI